MILTLLEKDYFIPEKWTQVSLGTFQEYINSTKDIEDDTTLNLLTIQAFTKAPISVLERLKLKDIDIILKELGKLLKIKINRTFNMIVEIEGVEYGFHPNLSDITMAEFVDLDNYCTDPWKNMHKIMAVLYREIETKKKDKYGIVEYDVVGLDRRSKIFKDKLSLATVNGASDFFLNIGMEYLSIMQSSLKAKTKTKKSEIPNTNLERSGAGIV